MKVESVAGQNDHRAGRVCHELLDVELVAQADVEDPGDYRINAIFGVEVRHQFHAMGHFDPDRVGSLLRGVANQDCQAYLWRERRERLPLNVFGQDCSERGLSRADEDALVLSRLLVCALLVLT